jgi:hypothetical protein
LSIIIRRYVDNMRFATNMAVLLIVFFNSFGSILFHCMYGCMFCMLLFNCVNYVFLLLYILIVIFMYFYCYVCSALGILFHCVVLCTVCV